jgi:hypothetical protein
MSKNKREPYWFVLSVRPEVIFLTIHANSVLIILKAQDDQWHECAGFERSPLWGPRWESREDSSR